MFEECLYRTSAEEEEEEGKGGGAAAKEEWGGEMWDGAEGTNTPDHAALDSGLSPGWVRWQLCQEGHGVPQTPSTGLRHPSFNHCRI